MADVGSFKHEIRVKKSPGDHEIAALARRQYGVVAGWQLAELGFGRGAIRHRVESGRLHAVYRGVWAVGHSVLPSRGPLMAAVLACGPGAMLSHRDAAAIFGLRPNASAMIDVSTPRRSRHGQAGIRLHRPPRLRPEDCVVHEGIPVTSVPRTLLDLAAVLRPRELSRAVEEAERLRLFDGTAIERVCERSRGRPGSRALAAALADHTGPAPLTRSELERRFLDLCQSASLPPPMTNVAVAGYEVDAFWAGERLVVELDGHAFHRSRAAFERDRVRDAALQVAGYRVIRITQRRLGDEPVDVLDALASLLAVEPRRRARRGSARRRPARDRDAHARAWP